MAHTNYCFVGEPNTWDAALSNCALFVLDLRTHSDFYYEKCTAVRSATQLDWLFKRLGLFCFASLRQAAHMRRNRSLAFARLVVPSFLHVFSHVPSLFPYSDRQPGPAQAHRPARVPAPPPHGLSLRTSSSHASSPQSEAGARGVATQFNSFQKQQKQPHQ